VTGLVLALAASVFTAAASVAQRYAAAPAPGETSFSWRLVLFLIRRPIWFLGILCMILGFVFQVAALREADLSLVQPVIATELILVFAFLAVRNRARVHRRDWAAAAAMAVGLGGFLALADPSGGTDLAPHHLWIEAGLVIFGAAAIVCGLAMVPLGRGRRPSSSRRAALLAVSAGILWGLVAAVVKELSGHLSGGLYGVFTNWSPYALLIVGAAAFFLTSNAFQAGSLAASQPGLTIVDPLVASCLGAVLFGERIRHQPWEVAGEALALAVMVIGVVLLTRSPLVAGEASDGLENAAPRRAAAAVGLDEPRPAVTAPPPDHADQTDPSGPGLSRSGSPSGFGSGSPSGASGPGRPVRTGPAPPGR
jgi:drug/metabolite transporter (DMT)-like permease